jgi:hypothetical protein
MGDSGNAVSRRGCCTAVNDREINMKTNIKLRSLHRGGLLAGVCGVLGLVLASQAGLAQQVAKDAPTVASASAVAQGKASEPAAFGALAPGLSPQAAKPVPAEEEETAKPKKPGEGLKVHGHWKIVIKNPDGTVDSTTEFENSLVTPGSGDILLGLLLSQQGVSGPWQIEVYGNLCGTASALSGCAIVPASVLTNPAFCASYNCSPNLTVTYFDSGTIPGLPSGAGFQLSGSFTAAAAGPLTTVATATDFCEAAVSNNDPFTVASPTQLSAAQCTNAAISIGLPLTPQSTLPAGIAKMTAVNFTRTNTAATVTSPGQLVQVTVTITFS